MTNNSFYKYVESRAQSGYGSAVLVKEQDDELYSLLVAMETAVSVFGSQDSFEFDLINSSTKGKVAGKVVLEEKETKVLLHRDNINRLEALKGRVLDFLLVTPDMMGWHFTGTINVKPDDAEGDVFRATVTITPMSAVESAMLDVRDMVQDTVLFVDEIPDRVDGLKAAGTEVTFVTDPADATLTCTIYDFVKGVKGTAVSTNMEGTVSGKVVTLKQSTGATAGTHYGIAYIKATKANYADWTTTIAVSTTKA